MLDNLFWASCLGLLALVGYWTIRREWLLAVLMLLLVGLVPYLLASSGAVSPPGAFEIKARGTDPELAIVFSLYFSMVLGMVSHYAFGRLERPETKRGKLDFGHLLGPIFVSPIIFFPLASLLHATEAGHGRASHLLLFLVAFENGFFWREFFENRRKAQIGEAK